MTSNWRSAVMHFVNGRVYCPACKVTAQVMKHPKAEVRCPACNTLTIPASGDDECS